MSYFANNTAFVAWAKLSEAKADKERIFAMLAEPELERAAKFHFEDDRLRFALGRFLTRSVLGRELARMPETIQFTYTDRQRPVFADADGISFSITHARDLVAVAFVKDARIGIDIEYMERKVDLLGVAEKILSDDDFQVFQALPEDEKVSAFFRVWTRKEAYLKATGEGLTDALKKISVSLQAEEIGTVTDARDQGADNWRLHSLDLVPGYEACVACDGERKIEVTPVRFS